tara:strand:- start:2292 stop:3116 length:825 start_codon:yes stop_codon:yes gene_type:complete
MRNLTLFLIVVISFVGCKKDDPDHVDPSPYECVIYKGDLLPQLGDSINYNIDTTTFKSILSGGEGVTWSFTGLKMQDSAKAHYIDTTGLKYSSSFPASIYTSTINEELVYLGVTSNGLEVQGAVIAVADTQFVAVYDKKYNQIDFPLSYLDDKSETYSYDETKYNIEIMVNGTKTPADSVELSRTGTIMKEVDGCGTLKMPNATYDVLRIYKEETIADTVVAHVFIGFGTKEFVIVEKETIYKTYEFVTDSLSAPVLIIELNDDKEAEVVRFQN